MGEWLTRRILRSFSGMEDEAAVPFEGRAPSGAPLDSWGLPPSAASRRDSEEMLARVGRSETESAESWRRIEEQLRGLGRRLDSSERSHSENNRVLSRTAQEINISAREQAQAFEQLGQNVVGLNDRLERLERSAASDGIKDAVKALHQGLSRLADQITATANNSTGQLAQVTTNLDKIASQLTQVSEDAEKADQLLELRIDSAERELGQRIDSTERAMDARLAVIEKTAQFNSNTLDHALEKFETVASQRAADQTESQRRITEHEESVHRLESSVTRLELLLPGPQLDERLGGVERSVHDLTDRLAQHDPSEKFDAAMQALSYRLEKLEKDHAELAAGLQAKATEPQAPASPEPPEFEPSAFEPPPHAEPPSVYEPQGYESPSETFSPHQDLADAFTPPQHGFGFDVAPDTRHEQHEELEEAFTPDFDDVFEETPSEPENFLSQARRSAREASDRAESERLGRLSSFRWSQGAAESQEEEKEKPRFLIPILVALLVVLAAAAALVLSQRAKAPVAAPKPVSAAPSSPTLPASPSNTAVGGSSQAAGETAGQGTSQSSTPSTVGNAQDYGSQRSEPAASDLPPPVPVQRNEASTAPVKPAANSGAAARATGLDRVIQLANSGNTTALTILGLRAADGASGVAVNLPDAIKYLTQAAEKGQAVAQYRLGTLYERGQGVAADATKAAHWYTLAAAQGNRKAMHNLAVAYASGAGVTKNMVESARWFAKAAALGLSDSQFNLAVLYERGEGVPQSLVDAYKWYSIAAAAGDAESKARIGVLQTQLSGIDRAAADRSSAAFHAAPLSRVANVPPEPADLGL